MAVAVVEVEVAIIERLFSLAAGTCFRGCCCCGGRGGHHREVSIFIGSWDML